MGKDSPGEDAGIIRSNEYIAMSNEYETRVRILG